ncbi:hypothetical protein EV360DRAFT_88819 [Lentinula raphanica]|nr:hypothetical protein EV360DRAFT_88819 [Lentinula raphanica]
MVLGFHEGIPSRKDYVFWRSKYAGGGNVEKEDILKTWAMPEHPEEMIGRMDEVRDRMYGPVEEQFDGPEGLAIERLKCLSPVKGADRAYAMGVSNQSQRNLEGPASNSKRMGIEETEGDRLQKDLLAITAEANLLGLAKVDPTLKERMDRQAELTNCPRIGSIHNTCWPSVQLNLASTGVGQGGSQENGERRSSRKGKGKEKGSLESIGQFGGPHLDGGDHEIFPTAMKNWSKCDENIAPEYFTIYELGWVWRLEEYCTIFFSGLHYHSGAASIATVPLERVYTRATLIMYPSGHELDGDSQVALGMLPKDTQKGLLTVNSEMRNFKTHAYDDEGISSFGNYMADGANFMDDQSFLNHIARNYLCLLTYLIRQAPREKLLRIDKDRLLSAFTMRSGGTRIAADSWKLGPGWTGEDTEVGREYPQDFDTMSEEELRRLWNTDQMSETIYGNEAMEKQRKDWAEERKRAVAALPVCHATGEANEEGELVGHHYRRVLRDSATRRARRNPERDPTKEDGQKKKTDGKKKTEGQGKPRKKGRKGKKQAREKGSGGSDNRNGYGADVSNDENGEDDDDGEDWLGLGTGGNRGGTMGQNAGLGPTTRSRTRQGDQLIPEQHNVNLNKSNEGKTPPTPPLHVLPLVRYLTRDSLEEQVEVLKDAANIPSNPTKLPPVGTSLPNLVSCYTSLSRMDTRLTAEATIRRQDILMLRMLVWGQLGFMKVEAVKSLHLFSGFGSGVGNPNESTPWFTTLVTDIKKWGDVQGSEKSFHPGSYLPETYEIVDFKPGVLRPGRCKMPSGSIQFGLQQADEWVRRWIGLQGKKDDYSSAFFIYLMQEWLGHGILGVHEVWCGAESIERRVLGREGEVRPGDIKDVVAEMKDLVDKEDIQGALEDLHESCWEIRSDEEKARWNLLCGLVKGSTLVFAPRNVVESEGTPAMAPIASTSVSGEVSKERGKVPNSLVDTLIDQVYHCLRLVGDNMSHGVVVPDLHSGSERDRKINIYLSEIAAESDMRLPFRELGKSRFYVLSAPQNPYTTHNLRTVSGLFSAIMVRVIHHSTPFLFNHPPYYASFDEWDQIYQAEKVAHPDPLDKYICNRAAYGRDCGPSRDPENAKGYWDAVQMSCNNSWLLDKDKYLDQKGNYLLSVVKILSSKSFYGIGKLTAFQIAVDYLKAGAFTATVEDFAETVRYVNLGGIGGLARLGYLEKKGKRGTRGKEEVQTAFKKAMVDFQKTWDERREGKGAEIDMIDVEHWLCKSSDTQLGRAAYSEIYK